MGSIIQNATIENVRIAIERGSFLIVNVDLHLQSGLHQGYLGDLCLYNPNYKGCKDIKGYASHVLYNIMQVCGVDDLSECQGKNIRVDGNDDRVSRIGHIIRDQWFSFEEDLKSEKVRKDNE